MTIFDLKFWGCKPLDWKCYIGVFIDRDFGTVVGTILLLGFTFPIIAGGVMIGFRRLFDRDKRLKSLFYWLMSLFLLSMLLSQFTDMVNVYRNNPTMFNNAVTLMIFILILPRVRKFFRIYYVRSWIAANVD
jgi:hypothetical protein